MSWNGNFDDRNDAEVGVIVAISAGVIVFFGIIVAFIEKTSPENGCFRVFDRNLYWTPFAVLFVMVAITITAAASAKPGSNLYVGVGASCFLVWAAFIAFVVWRGRKRILTNIRARRNLLNDGTGGSSTVFAVPINCDISTYDNACGASNGNTINTYANQIDGSDNYGFCFSMTSGGGGFDGGGGGFDGGGGGFDGGSGGFDGGGGGFDGGGGGFAGGGGGFDGGSGFSGGSGDTGGTTTSSSSTGDNGGGGC